MKCGRPGVEPCLGITMRLNYRPPRGNNLVMALISDEVVLSIT